MTAGNATLWLAPAAPLRESSVNVAERLERAIEAGTRAESKPAASVGIADVARHAMFS
jgi:hypothetical protein